MLKLQSKIVEGHLDVHDVLPFFFWETSPRAPTAFLMAPWIPGGVGNLLSRTPYRSRPALGSASTFSFTVGTEELLADSAHPRTGFPFLGITPKPPKRST